VRKWVRSFKDGRDNVHDKPRSGRPSVITDDLVRAVDAKLHEDRRFTIFTLSLKFLICFSPRNYLKEFLGGQRFDTDEEVKTTVEDWLSSQAADFYDEGIQKLVERYDKCLNKQGNYVEK